MESPNILECFKKFDNAKILWSVAENVFNHLLSRAQEIQEEQAGPRMANTSRSIGPINDYLKRALTALNIFDPIQNNEFIIELSCEDVSPRIPKTQYYIGFELSYSGLKCNVLVFTVDNGLNVKTNLIHGNSPLDFFRITKENGMDEVYHNCVESLKNQS